MADGGITENKKTAPRPQMGQELHSCDTTQIDILLCISSRLCVPSNASRLITGGLPSDATRKALSLRPQQSIPPAAPTVITPPTALLTAFLQKYYSVSKVYAMKLWDDFIICFSLCQGAVDNFFEWAIISRHVVLHTFSSLLRGGGKGL